MSSRSDLRRLERGHGQASLAIAQAVSAPPRPAVPHRACLRPCRHNGLRTSSLGGRRVLGEGDEGNRNERCDRRPGDPLRAVDGRTNHHYAPDGCSPHAPAGVSPSAQRCPLAAGAFRSRAPVEEIFEAAVQCQRTCAGLFGGAGLGALLLSRVDSIRPRSPFAFGSSRLEEACKIIARRFNLCYKWVASRDGGEWGWRW